jgi:hypothetical protein
VQQAQAFPGGGCGQPPTEALGVLYLGDVFGKPQPGHLHGIERIGLLEPKRAYLAEHHAAVAAQDFLPRPGVTLRGPRQQLGGV